MIFQTNTSRASFAA